MLPRRLTLAALALFCTSPLLRADILVLKNGDRKEGKIISESATAVRMRYKLTPKIEDEKDFPKADIAEVIRQRPSELALQEQKLKEILPTRDMMTADEYERLIQDKLRPFVNQFPGTPEATEVEGIIKELQAEKEKVVSGQLKVDTKWLTPEEVKRDDYNIRAYKLRNDFKTTAASINWEDWVQALRVYDRFIDPTTGFFASTHYPKLVPEVLEVLKNYENILLKMIREQPTLYKAQQDNLARLVEPDKSRTEAAIKSRLDAWKAQYDVEKRSRVRWLVPYKMDLASLNEAHKAVIAERAKLQTLDLEGLAKQNELLVAVFRYLADENAVEAETALAAAQQEAGTKQEYTRIFADLRSKISTLKNDIQRKKNAQRTFNAGTTAIGGGTGAIMDEKVAKALADAEAGKKPEAPPAAAEDPSKAPIGQPPAAAKPAAPAPAPAPAPAAPSSYTPPAEEGGMGLMIPIGGGLLLVVLLVLMIQQKKKQKAEDAE